MNRFFSKAESAIWLILSLLVRSFTKVKKNRILCWSYFYTKYSCNPKYMTEYLLSEHPNEYEIYWCFRKDTIPDSLPEHIKIVKWRTWKYLVILNTAGFLFSNARTGTGISSFIKRKHQRYIMTWHSSMGIKKIEQDAGNALSDGYIRIAKHDSSICNLILSGCRFRTDVIRRAFWYDGEILEKGTPRNDMLFKNHNELKAKFFTEYNIPEGDGLLLYAPTFRGDYSLKYYKLDWDDMFTALSNKFGKEFHILLRLHPNFLVNDFDGFVLNKHPKVIDVTHYQDIQELLCVSDILVTDYSSSMFDFALLYKPCFIYATDYMDYDRGTYFQLNELPFPIAYSNNELLSAIKDFDFDKYEARLHYFNENVIHTYETGNSCRALYDWMSMQSKKM